MVTTVSPLRVDDLTPIGQLSWTPELVSTMLDAVLNYDSVPGEWEDTR